jgi:uncharacterized membrane protein YphA (DoxX/SURF4 family)
MAASPQARGLRVLSVLLGVFFLFEGISKIGWLLDPSPLTARLTGYLENANTWNRAYLQGVCIPWAPVFARLVLFGELATGAALIAGVWARYAAIAAFLMVMNIHFASGLLFQHSFLTNGYGLPVVGGLLALGLGAVGLPASLKRK